MQSSFSDLSQRGGLEQPSGSLASDLLEPPKSSRRQSSSSAVATSSLESPTKLKSEKSRQSRRSLKGCQSPARECTDGTSSKCRQIVDPALGISSPPMPDIPNKTRRKKPKESSIGASSRSSSRLKAQATSLAEESPFSDPGGRLGLLSMRKNSDQLDQASKMEGVETRDEKANQQSIMI